MAYEPRDYQDEDLEKVRREYEKGNTRLLGHAATGLGKTVFATFLPKRFPELFEHGMLVIAPRREIVFQFRDDITQMYPDASVGIEMGRHRAKGREDVVVSSADTLGRMVGTRIEKFVRDYGIIVVDECHHTTEGGMNDNILSWFGQGAGLRAEIEPGVKPLVVHLTATPNRTDGQSLAPFVDAVAFSRSIRFGVENGWLTDIRAYRVTEEAIGGVLNMDSYEADLIVHAYQKYCLGMKTLVFAGGLDVADEAAERFGDVGISAAYLDGETEKEDRDRILTAHKDGELDVITNYGVLCLDADTEILTSEGWTGIDEMTYDHEVANWEDGDVFFDNPKFIVRRNRLPEEKMVTLDYRQNLRVTEDHRMLYRSQNDARKGRDFRIEHAKDIVGISGQLPVSGVAEPLNVSPTQPDSISDDKRDQLITAQTYNLMRNNGYDREEAEIEAARRVDRKYNMRHAEPEDLSEAQCKLIGFWIGDGTVTELQNGGKEWRVVQSMVYPQIISEVDKIIEETGYDCARKEYPDRLNGQVRWSFAKGQNGGAQELNGIFDIIPYLDKDGSPLLWGLNEAQFDALLYGLHLADGDHGNSSDMPDTLRISSTNGALLDVLQSVGCVRGYRARISYGQSRKEGHAPLHRITLRKSEYHTMGYNHTLEEEEGWKSERVWCVTSTTGNIITRRQGTVTVTGNTEGYNDPHLQAGILQRATKSDLLYQQIIGRFLRPSCPVDTVDTAEERKQMIAESDKPAAHIIDIVGVTEKNQIVTVPEVFGLSNELDTEGKKMIEEVMDVVDEIEEEEPERPIRDVESLEDIETAVQKVDVWSQTVYNEKLKKVSPLRWVISENVASLYLPENPNPGGYREETPMIVRLQPSEQEGLYDVVHIDVGGWVEPPRGRGYPKRASVEHKGQIPERRLKGYMKKVDRWVMENNEKVYKKVRRDFFEANEPASDKQIERLKREGVEFGQNITALTAQTLLAHAKIEGKVEKIIEGENGDNKSQELLNQT
ncbi:superfamily II helicase [Salinibacter phage M8CC-19]|uniref:Superfamily II helicase n=2 Tax=Kryptosalinivirus M8CC19 TaxID=2560720 RepID=A0A2I6UG51_9CAUD|nr:superfamily II helicase [Salinibacter phage M8CC-19]AUO78955.1 superfamily II helicase [Salinibacter phage M8CC-19]AUO79189.1 superfamily II helicase [Salinibacter phage M31CC-1]